MTFQRLSVLAVYAVFIVGFSTALESNSVCTWADFARKRVRGGLLTRLNHKSLEECLDGCIGRSEECTSITYIAKHERCFLHSMSDPASHLGGFNNGVVYVKDCTVVEPEPEDGGATSEHEGDLQVRLISNGQESTIRGRVEVRHSGEWGTVCDDYFDKKDAAVLCRMLGHDNTSHAAVIPNPEGPAEGRVWLTDLMCLGDERTLLDCDRSGWGVVNCDHSEDVAIECARSDTSKRDTEETGTDSSGVEIRLVGGETPLEGRLEIRNEAAVNGSWGTVCDDYFNRRAATVACRMLGHHGRGAVIDTEPGEGVIWLSDVMCRGSETDLDSCPHSPWGVHNCQHSEDVGIRCSP